MSSTMGTFEKSELLTLMSFLVVEEAGVLGGIHRAWANNW
jgi:hypothetical protein